MSTPQTVNISHDFALPVERVYAYLAEHEHLGPLFGATITRLRDGDTSRNGAGSVRRLKVGPLPAFEETVTEAVDNTRIGYRISKGSPLRNHRGVMEFRPVGTGCHLDYRIEFDSAVPGLGPLVRLGLERTLRRGLRTVDAKA
ncbi:MAG: Polyketide cyclase / dehydrase and lipid transport [Frankiales bacterium]|nr:Polyketide cyclase / dehydrase and lipid transport [Frankiales bacterium]